MIPADGRKIDEIILPVSLVTSCSFGGEELEDLYITTAMTGLADEVLEQQPLAGSLFVCRPGVKGIKSNYFNKN